MKYQEQSAETAFDSEGLGVLLIISYIVVIVLFIGWAMLQKDDMSTSANAMATSTLKGTRSDLNKEITQKNDDDEEDEDDEVDEDGVELTDISLAREEKERKSSESFTVENPMTRKPKPKELEKLRSGVDEVENVE